MAEMKYFPTHAVEYALENHNRPYSNTSEKDIKDRNKGYDSQKEKSRSPFFDFETWEGNNNCTHFVSQCILAGFLKTKDPTVVHSKLDKYSGDSKSPKNAKRWFYKSVSDAGDAWKGANSLYVYADYWSKQKSRKGLNFSFVTRDSAEEFMKYQDVQEGDIIFADWPKRNGVIDKHGEVDGIIDHSMIVTNKNSWRIGYNEIQVTYQSSIRKNRGLGDINEDYMVKKNNKKIYKAIFYVYRPTIFKM